ncbi:MAG TPA: HEPN domain-containing protein [Candidatus Hypogeohydataceae bacterium YC40]
MKNAVKNWLDSPQYDLETAENMFAAGRYIYTVFMCHVALEKALKAKVEEITFKTPPKTHDLGYLVELAGLFPDKDIEEFIVEISNLSVVTRYPNDFQRMLTDFSKERVEFILIKTGEIFQWVKKSMLL